jgi:uncharacterized protein (TIGR02246 family)
MPISMTRRRVPGVAGALAALTLWTGAAVADTKPQSPEALHQALAAAFNAKDLEQVVALYETDAALVSQPGGPPAIGGTDLQEALKGFVALPGQMDIVSTYTIQTGDIALARSLWTIRDGDTVMQGSGTEIMRRQADGSWLFAVDHPFGADSKP